MTSDFIKSFSRRLSLILLKVLASVALCLSLHDVSHAQMSGTNPDIEWHKLETEHFEIVFDSRHYRLAADFARYAETAWLTLVPVLRTWPDKTVIVIDDGGDQANGLASGFPYPQIHLFPAAPAPGDTIGDTGPWNLELVTHEYTHVLNFQPAHGVFHALRNVFGNIVRPNILLPRWYLEGLAVETETRFSPSGGRLRSPDFTAIPRAMVQDGLLRREDIARIGETSIPDWPGGARPYLFGGLLWEKLARENLSTIGDLNDHFAHRMPFLIDGPLRDRTGQDWQATLESVYTDIEARAAAQIEEICEYGCVEGAKLGENGFFTRSPVLSRPTPGVSVTPSLAYVSREHNRDSIIYIVDREPDGRFDLSKAVRAVKPTNTSRLAWLPDASALVYDGIDTFGRFEDRSELWLYNRAKKKTFRLSKGLRGREPDLSADGRHVAFVQLTPGRTQIAVAPLLLNPNPESTEKPTIGTTRILYAPTSDNRVSWPTFVNATTLVFVERSADGKEVLKAIDLPAAETAEGVSVTPRTIASDGNVTFPRTVAPGRLIFASNRSGVTNLYQAEFPAKARAHDFKLEKIRPLTNSTTRAWNGDVDPVTDTLIYARLDGDGSHLRTLTPAERQQNGTIKSGRLAQIPLLIDRPEPAHKVPDVTLPPSALEAHDFNVWPYLLPRYWMPYAAFVPGGAFLSAATSAGDPMGRHTLAAAVSSDTRIGKPNLFAAYSNATTPVKVTVMADDFWQRLSSSGLDRRSSTADLSGLFYLPYLSNKWTGEVGMSHRRTETPSTATGTDVRIESGPRVGFLWQDITQRGFEIAPEEGGFVRMTYAKFLPDLGNLNYDKTDLAMTGYASRVSFPRLLGWLPERHVIGMSMTASWLPALDRLLLAPSSVSLPIETVALGPASTSFVMRGYPSGSFLSRKIVRASAEYHMPLSATYHGFGTTAAFIRRWHGVIFGDLATAEGAIYDYDHARYSLSEIGHMFGAVGLEARLDTTLFYHLPVQFIFGVHYGLDKRINPNGAYPVLSISL